MSDEAPSIPYEQARDELISVVQRLETGGTTLEESLALWERGEELAAICQQWLDGARTRLAAASGRRLVEPLPAAGAGWGAWAADSVTGATAPGRAHATGGRTNAASRAVAESPPGDR